MEKRENSAGQLLETIEEYTRRQRSKRFREDFLDLLALLCVALSLAGVWYATSF